MGRSHVHPPRLIPVLAHSWPFLSVQWGRVGGVTLCEGQKPPTPNTHVLFCCWYYHFCKHPHKENHTSICEASRPWESVSQDGSEQHFRIQLPGLKLCSAAVMLDHLWKVSGLSLSQQ